FSATFLAFLKENHIDPGIYQVHRALPRYVRVLRYSQRETAEVERLIKQIQHDAGCKVSRVHSVPGFLAIEDQAVRLSQLGAYTSGDIVGIDVSSGIAALSLSVTPGENVLDLCCAPGAKLIFIAELLNNSTSSAKGTVTGVDISPHRAATCRSLVKRHAGMDKAFIRVYVEDGTTFGFRAPQDKWWDPKQAMDAQAKAKCGPEWSSGGTSRRKRQKCMFDGQPWFAPKLLSTEYACSGRELYDRVLVDAECTHDGSLVHIQKYEQWGWDQLDAQVVGEGRSQTVPVLQSQLLENGWRLLKVGGVLVYSTCSLSKYQNECVLGGFLSRHDQSEACVEPIPMFGGNSNEIQAEMCNITASPIWSPTPDELCNERMNDQIDLFERMKHAVRLNPLVSNTSGMFIARIRK
ncbi:S-adenosyl-L-methionine-dependent methyltransferase, partial [Martensiomyces pterosporus]